MKSTTCEYRLETCFLQNARDGIALITLDFDDAILHGATATTSRLHLLGQGLLLWKANALKPFDDSHPFAATMGRLTDDVEAAAIGILLSTF